MDDSLLPRLKKTTVKVLRDAYKAGGPIDRGEFTMGAARRSICAKMGFEEGSLDGTWKSVVKDLVNRFQDELVEAQSAASPSPPPTSTSTSHHRSTSHESTVSKKRPQAKRGSRKREEEEVEEAEDDDAEEDASGSGDESLGSSIAAVPKKRSKPGASTAKTARRKKGKSGRNPRDDDDDDDDERAGSEGQEGEASVVDDGREAEASESEMSSVYDVAPSRSREKTDTVDERVSKSRKRKSRSKGKGGDDSDSTRSVRRKKGKKDQDNGLDPDEAKVNELKRIVVACGVRKQWSKEFADYPKPKEQIRILQRILSELGMKGNPTIGKARILKERRELAAELDDVRQFEATRGLSAKQPRASRSRAPTQVNKCILGSETNEEYEDDEGAAQPKQQSALGAVLDFLGDQSD